MGKLFAAILVIITAVSAGVFVCVEALAPGDDLRRVSVGIAAAMVVNTGLLALIFALSRHEGEEA